MLDGQPDRQASLFGEGIVRHRGAFLRPMVEHGEAADISLRGLRVLNEPRPLYRDAAIAVLHTDGGARIAAKIAGLYTPIARVHHDLVGLQFIPHDRLLRRAVRVDSGKHGEALLLQKSAHCAGASPTPRVRAYLATCTSLAICFVLEVGVFASRHVGQLAERDLIGLAPLLFLGFALWLARGGPGEYGSKAVAAILAAGSVLAIPVRSFVTPDALPSAFSIIPLLQLRELTSTHTTELALSLGVALAAGLFVLLPRSALLVLPALVGLALVGGSVCAGREVVRQAKAQQLLLLGPERRWIDAKATGPVAYVYDGGNYWNAVWATIFWNRRVRWVYDLPHFTVPARFRSGRSASGRTAS